MNVVLLTNNCELQTTNLSENIGNELHMVYIIFDCL